MADTYDLRELALRFARFRLPMRLVTGGISLGICSLAIVFWVLDPGLILNPRPLSDSHSTTLFIANVCALLVVCLGAWVSLWGLRQVAVSVSCDGAGLTFTYRRGRTRVVAWSRADTKFNIHDWRDSAHRRDISPTFALSAKWGPWILAILTPEAFDGIMSSSEAAGFSAIRGGVNRWLTGSPLSTVVYRFVRKPDD